MKKKKLVIAILMLIMLTPLFLFLRPPRPREWSKVKIGMKRDEFLKLYPNIYTAMRGAKGFDSLDKENSFPYYSDGVWQMVICYDKDDIVNSISYHYWDRNCGLLNRMTVIEKPSETDEIIIDMEIIEPPELEGIARADNDADAAGIKKILEENNIDVSISRLEFEPLRLAVKKNVGDKVITSETVNEAGVSIDIAVPINRSKEAKKILRDSEYSNREEVTIYD